MLDLNLLKTDLMCKLQNLFYKNKTIIYLMLILLVSMVILTIGTMIIE